MTLVPMPAPTSSSRPTWIEVMDRGSELAEVIANTDFVPRGLRGNQPAILAAILYGHEVGLEPMQSLAKIAVIDGRPSLSAEAQRALILGAGHEIWVEESTNTRAIVAGRRRDGKTTSRVTWTLDDAKRARIAGKANWQAYPRQMLVARASAELARQLFADTIGGMAAIEELDEYVEGAEPDVVEGGEKPKTTRRRSRPVAAAPGPEPALPADDKPIDTIAGPEPLTPPDPPSEAALRKLFALFGERGPVDRDERLKYCTETIGRPIASSSELTALEVTRIIEALEAKPMLPAKGELPPDEQAHVDDAVETFDAREADTPPLPGEEGAS